MKPKKRNNDRKMIKAIASTAKNLKKETKNKKEKWKHKKMWSMMN